jgi:hypothetical protein
MRPHERFQDITREPAPSLVREFWLFLLNNKKWWLMPVVAAILLLGLLVFLSATPLAPFLYTIF